MSVITVPKSNLAGSIVCSAKGDRPVQTLPLDGGFDSQATYHCTKQHITLSPVLGGEYDIVLESCEFIASKGEAVQLMLLHMSRGVDTMNGRGEHSLTLN